MSVVSSDPLRLGVLGCSSIAQRSIIPAIQASDGLTLGAVASRSPAQAADWADRLGCQGLSYEELMASDELDAVYVSVPTGLHAAWGRKVLSHGKHLLLEKSFTTTLEETRELLALAAQHELVAMEALAYVHHPFVQTIHALLRSGRLGAIRHVDARFGFPERSDEDIRYRRELGGGAILDTLIYPLSFCLDIDPQPFLNVSARVINHPRFDVDGRGHLQINWPTWTAQISYGFGMAYQNTCTVWGEAGVLTAERVFTRPPDMGGDIHLRLGRDTEVVSVEPADHFKHMLDAFCQRLHHPGPHKEDAALVRRMKLIDYVYKLAQHTSAPYAPTPAKPPSHPRSSSEAGQPPASSALVPPASPEHGPVRPGPHILDSAPLDEALDPELSVVIPVYGSRLTIEDTVHELESSLEAQGLTDYELLLVDDRAPDDISETLAALAQANSRIQVLELVRNFGQHNAIMAGLNHARGAFTVLMDDDGQHDPTYIGTMLDSLREGHEVVFLTYDRRAYGVFKVWGSKLNGFLATRLLGKPSSLYLSSFKAFQRGVRDRIVHYKGPFPYIDGLILGNTDRYTTLVGKHRSSLKERSSYTLVGLIEHALNMITSFSVRPLRMISILGCLIGVASVLLLAVLSVLRILYPAYAPPGWTMMVCLLTSFGALQLVCLGVVGEYVGRVLLHSGTRPQYAVRRRIGGGSPP